MVDGVERETCGWGRPGDQSGAANSGVGPGLHRSGIVLGWLRGYDRPFQGRWPTRPSPDARSRSGLHAALVPPIGYALIGRSPVLSASIRATSAPDRLPPLVTVFAELARLERPFRPRFPAGSTLTDAPVKESGAKWASSPAQGQQRCLKRRSAGKQNG